MTPPALAGAALLLVGLMACGDAGPAPDPAAADPASPPGAPPHANVLVILADDLGVDRVGVYAAHPHPGRTPVIDDLAAEGVLFRNAYAQPVCSSTRMAALSGRQAFRTGIGVSVPWSDVDGPNGGFEPGPDEILLPRVLGETHRTAAIGKWHLATEAGGGYGHPIQAGFEVFRGARQNLAATPSAQRGYFEWEKSVADRQGHRQEERRVYATTDNVDDALKLIGSFGDEPWFVWLAFNAPHAPLHRPPHHLRTVDLSGQVADVTLYKAMVEALDTEIGRLLAALPAAVRSRTHVLFMGDNGTPSTATPGDRGDRGKASMHEGGIHVPLIVAGPAVVQPGREVTALVHAVDVFASVLELAGVHDPGTGTDSVSLVPYLVDPDAAPRRDWVFSELFKPNGHGPRYDDRWAIRDARFKLMHGARGSELHDLLLDPDGSHDLLDDPTPEHAAARDRLLDVVETLRGERPRLLRR